MGILPRKSWRRVEGRHGSPGVPSRPGGLGARSRPLRLGRNGGGRRGPALEIPLVLGAEPFQAAFADAVGEPDGPAPPRDDAAQSRIPPVALVPRASADQHGVPSPDPTPSPSQRGNDRSASRMPQRTTSIRRDLAAGAGPPEREISCRGCENVFTGARRVAVGIMDHDAALVPARRRAAPRKLGLATLALLAVLVARPRHLLLGRAGPLRARRGASRDVRLRGPAAARRRPPRAPGRPGRHAGAPQVHRDADAADRPGPVPARRRPPGRSTCAARRPRPARAARAEGRAHRPRHPGRPRRRGGGARARGAGQRRRPAGRGAPARPAGRRAARLAERRAGRRGPPLLRARRPRRPRPRPGRVDQPARRPRHAGRLDDHPAAHQEPAARRAAHLPAQAQRGVAGHAGRVALLRSSRSSRPTSTRSTSASAGGLAVRGVGAAAARVLPQGDPPAHAGRGRAAGRAWCARPTATRRSSIPSGRARAATSCWRACASSSMLSAADLEPPPRPSRCACRRRQATARSRRRTSPTTCGSSSSSASGTCRESAGTSDLHLARPHAAALRRGGGRARPRPARDPVRRGSGATDPAPAPAGRAGGARSATGEIRALVGGRDYQAEPVQPRHARAPAAGLRVQAVRLPRRAAPRGATRPRSPRPRSWTTRRSR